MGNYSTFKIEECTLICLKHFIPDVHVRESDRTVRTVKKTDEFTGRQYEQTEYVYQVSVKSLKRRLTLDGFTYAALEGNFKNNVERRISWARARRHDDAQAKDDLAIFEKASLGGWLRALKQVITGQKCGASQRVVGMLAEYPDYQIEMTEYYFGSINWPTESIHYLIRAALEVVPDEVICELDVTDFVESGEYDFEDLDPTAECLDRPKDVFDSAMRDIRSLMRLAPRNRTLARLLFANVITAYETYLADTARQGILSRKALLRRFIETNAPREDKFSMTDLIAKYDGIEEYVAEILDRLSFHNVETARRIYQNVLLVNFPNDRIESLRNAVDIRHDIIHRNGKLRSGKEVPVKMKSVEELVRFVIETVDLIDSDIREGLLDATR